MQGGGGEGGGGAAAAADVWDGVDGSRWVTHMRKSALGSHRSSSAERVGVLERNDGIEGLLLLSTKQPARKGLPETGALRVGQSKTDSKTDWIQEQGDRHAPLIAE